MQFHKLNPPVRTWQQFSDNSTVFSLTRNRPASGYSYVTTSLHFVTNLLKLSYIERNFLLLMVILHLAVGIREFKLGILHSPGVFYISSHLSEFQQSNSSIHLFRTTQMSCTSVFTLGVYSAKNAATIKAAALIKADLLIELDSTD